MTLTRCVRSGPIPLLAKLSTDTEAPRPGVMPRHTLKRPEVANAVVCGSLVRGEKRSSESSGRTVIPGHPISRADILLDR